MKNTPPRWADRILEWYCADYFLEEVQGDLHEWYAGVGSDKSQRMANLRYFLAVLRYFSWFRLKPVHRFMSHPNPLTMKNMLLLTYRHLKKDKLSGAVRMINLILGITVFLLACVYAQYELSYDKHHKHADSIYRAGFQFDGKSWAASPLGMGLTALETIPEVTNMARFFPINQTDIRYEDRVFAERNGFFTDSTVFNLFTLPLLQGNPKTALTDPWGIVLTERLAKKYFGDEDPMGKSILMSLDTDSNTGETFPRTVTGILADLPEQTHLPFDFLVSPYAIPVDFIRAWQNNWVFTYLQIPNPDRVSVVKERLVEAAVEVEWQSPDELEGFAANLIPIRDIHLRTQHEKEYADNGNIYYVLILLAIGLFVLIISSINFINLTIMRGLDRAKEVGLRKTIGATRGQLIYQFMGETFILLLVAGFVSVGLLALLEPMLQQFTKLDLPLNAWFHPSLLLWLVAILGIIELLSGVYPAWVLSRMSPAESVKPGSHQLPMRKIGFTRQGLVVTQFTLSILLVIGSLVVYQQLTYLLEANLGFEKEQIALVEITNDMYPAMEAIHDELKRIPGVEKVTTSTDVPGYRVQILDFRRMQDEEAQLARTLYADEEFLSVYNIELARGENFHTPITRRRFEYLLNETAAETYFPETDAVGQQLILRGDTGTVVGLVKDFNFRSLHHAVEPIIIASWPLSTYGYISLKIDASAAMQVVEGVTEVGSRVLSSSAPMEAEFLEDRFAQLYSKESTLRSVVWVFCLITILLTLSGILGIATYQAKQRAKEVAVRRVLGSSIRQVLLLLSRNFLMLLMISCLLGIPGAYFLADWWLSDFAYRVTQGIGTFALAGIGMALLVLSSASLVIWRAARANPATVLKSE